MKGSCLCGDVKFELNLEEFKIYQCHCNLCRKQTGTASSCGGVVKEENFAWLGGQKSISKWQKESGFTSHFCSNCGSSVPNKFRGKPYYWVPAGALESGRIVTAVNIFVEEKAAWSNVNSDQGAYEGRPSVERMIELA
ncbi:GFA family protein [Agaribacterium sp. ZY112]|uniref:GFA family protein n=1 Tax=Agaribacterium sp. ZY112 TaxID=3233574 RepID=UPI00352347AC